MPLSDLYDVREHLYDGRTVAVFRARQKNGGAPVILKTPKPVAGAAVRLRHEYSIMKDLALPGVVRARGLEEHGSEVTLVLDDLGGETLAARLRKGPAPLPDALRI